MKKALFASVILLALTVTKSFAQDKVSTGPELSIGIDGGIPVGDFKEGYKFGIGGTAKFAYNFDENVAITLQSGYISFSGKDFGTLGKNSALGFIPIKVGGRYTFPGGFFIEPQLGVTNINKRVGTKFTYGGNLGYRMTPGIDVSARYEGISASGSNLSFIGFRVAYSFPFGSK